MWFCGVIVLCTLNKSICNSAPRVIMRPERGPALVVRAVAAAIQVSRPFYASDHGSSCSERRVIFCKVC